MALYDTTQTATSPRPYGRVVSTCVLAGLLLGTRARSGFLMGPLASLERIGLVDRPQNANAQDAQLGQAALDPIVEQIQLQAELERIKEQIDSTDTSPVVINTQPSAPVVDTSPDSRSPTIVQTQTGTPIYSFESLFGQGVVESTVVPLSGTFEREGVLKSAVDVGVEQDIQYIQKTIYNDHFAYLGAFSRPLLSKVLNQGGVVVQIEDPQSILEEGLFGDRVWLIQGLETREQKNKTLMIVYFDQARSGQGDAWYMQFDNDHYAQIKEELPTLFAQWYDW